MPIEFRCTNCQQQLRVPDDSAGKNAKCPKCGSIAVIPTPGGGAEGATPPANLPAAGPSFSPNYSPGAPSFSPAAPGSSPFGDAAQAGGGNPFAGDYPAKPSLNPYASPAGGYAPTNLGVPSLPVTNQRVEAGHVWNYAWQVWQTNLGLLVGVTLVFIGISYAVAIPIGVVQFLLEQNDNKEAAMGVAILGNFVSNLVQMFLTIGQVKVALKLCRQQPATFGEMFSGGGQFLPILGMSILAGLAVVAGTLLCVVPAIFMVLTCWPCYYLVVDQKTPVLESFTTAYRVTEGNRLTSFLLWLLSIAVVILGFLALCVGILFAAPLVTVMWATAYLMMSGQIPVPQPSMATPGYYPPGPPAPGKF